MNRWAVRMLGLLMLLVFLLVFAQMARTLRMLQAQQHRNVPATAPARP